MFTRIIKSKKTYVREMINQKLEEAEETVWETLEGLEAKKNMTCIEHPSHNQAAQQKFCLIMLLMNGRQKILPHLTLFKKK